MFLDSFPSSLKGSWQDSVPHRLLAGASISSLPCGSLHRAAHSTAAGFHQSELVRDEERGHKMEATVFL